jgi:NADH-quinone oxidoreductase subunit M
LFIYTNKRSFLLEDLYKLNYPTRTIVDIPSISRLLLKSTYSFPYLASKCVPKAPAVGTMLLSGIMLKMGLYSIIRWQLPIAPLAAKVHVHQFRSAGVIYGSIHKT